jgi:hypothetical protein
VYFYSCCAIKFSIPLNFVLGIKVFYKLVESILLADELCVIFN